MDCWKNFKHYMTRKRLFPLVSRKHLFWSYVSLTSVASEPATEVGQPLPSTMMEADNVCPLPSAKALPSGSKTSKYLLTENDKSYTLPANERDDWSEVQSDPVFAKIPAKCETFTFDALRARRDAMAAIPEDRENKQISSTDQKPHKLYPTDQRIAQTVDADESGNSSLSREQEDRLAALGVTGTAKPVQNSLRPFQAPHTSYGIHAPIAIPSEQPNRKRSYDAMSYETPRTPRFSEKATSDRDGCTKPEIDHTYQYVPDFFLYSIWLIITAINGKHLTTLPTSSSSFQPLKKLQRLQV